VVAYYVDSEDVNRRFDRRFEEANPEYDVVFEPIDFARWFDLANEYRKHGQYRSAMIVYRALLDSLDDNMERQCSGRTPLLPSPLD